MNKKRFGKNDLVFIGGILAAALLVFVVIHVFFQEEGSYVQITVDGALYGTYSLHEDQIIEIKKDGVVTNTLEIKGGCANMTDADCPDQLCVHQKAIEKSNESIICLPNKVIVTVIRKKQDKSFDSMAG